ncbi:MAG: cell division protein ZapE [Rhizobiaceae bacterium]
MSLRDASSALPSVAHRYRHLVEASGIRRDAAQEKAVAALDRLIGEISSSRLAAKSSALGWLFARRQERKKPIKGLYIHGGVGTGKTMLMDMFFELVPSRRKRRAHFNDFMTDVHDRIDAHRKALKRGEAKGDDPIPPVAAAIAEEARVLCFDEFTVTDIADAMILSRLFSALFSQGVVLIATSNVAPHDLYRDGLNRQLFLPFIDLLEEHLQVLRLDSGIDYRQEKLSRLPVYLTPLGAETDRRMDEAWKIAANGDAEAPVDLTVKGRIVHVPRAVRDVARFSFADLCEKPHGARDFLAMAARFHTIFIDHIPVLEQAHRNEIKRFILLIDTLYDRHARIVVSAEAAPEKLYAGRRGTEAFEFERTASRLIEMQSHEWLETAKKRLESAA